VCAIEKGASRIARHSAKAERVGGGGDDGGGAKEDCMEGFAKILVHRWMVGPEEAGVNSWVGVVDCVRVSGAWNVVGPTQAHRRSRQAVVAPGHW
jgi:hypothetical protein